MTHGADDLLATRRSLLARLKDAGDQSGWQQFFDLYSKLLYRVAFQSGLTDAEAKDAVQETVIAVARHIPEFRYDPARCSFKSWLMLIARQRIVHQFRKRAKAGAPVASGSPVPTSRATLKRELAGADPRTATIDRVPDPAAEARLQSVWDEEWEKHVLSAALEQVKQQVSDRQFQIFDLYVLQNWSVKEVTSTLRVNAAQVYLAKHRVSGLLKKAVRKVEQRP